MASLRFSGLSIADNDRQGEHITLKLDNKALKQKSSQFSGGRMSSCIVALQLSLLNSLPWLQNNTQTERCRITHRQTTTIPYASGAPPTEAL